MSRNKLSIAIWNAQSIHPKINELSLFLNQNDIDIFLFSETWLKHDLSFSLHGYRVYRKDRPCTDPNKKIVGGGVAIAIKSDIRHSLIGNLRTTVIETIGIEIETLNEPIQFYATYFPGSKLNPTKLANFKKDLIYLTSSRKPYFLCGDLNSKHRYWNCTKANKAGQILYSEMSVRNFSVYFPPTPTYFPPQTNRSLPSTIDIVLSNGLKEVEDIHSVNALSSDHQPVLFSIEMKPSVRPLHNLSKRCYSKANWSKFKDYIQSNIDLRLFDNNIKCPNDIDKALDFYTKCILNAENVSVPFATRTRSTAPLLDPAVAIMISFRNLKRRQWQRLRLPDLKKVVNSLNRLIRARINESKNVVWNRNLSRIEPNSKHLWRVTKLLKNKENRIPPLKGPYGCALLTDSEKAEAIVNAFENAHSTTFSDRSDASIEAEVSSSSLNVNFFSAPVIESQMPTPREISKLIRKLKIKKSPGNDKIPNILVKHLPRKGILMLMHILRACLKLSYFPISWKTAKVIPLPKPNKDSSDAGNYRPISLLSTLSKIFERMILNRIMEHLKQNDIILNEQFGFRKGHSSNHQLKRISHFIRDSLSMKRSTGMLTFDIEKAFDSVWHKAMVHKLFKLKVPLYLVKMISSFLSNRSFFVSINGTNSSIRNIVAGLPQGSVLSPTLFNVFTSDLAITATEKGLFADDTSIFTAGKSPNKIIKNLNKASKQLSDYCTRWKIKLNPTKTQALYFTRRRANRWLPSSEVTVLGSNISWNDEVKYLGVTLDKTLCFNRHTDLTVQKALKFTGILFPLLNRKSHLNLSNKIAVYKAMIRSIILYACPVWGNCAEVHLNKLQLIQNKCLRLILNAPYNHPTYDLHRKANLPTIKVQIQKVNSKFVSELQASENPLIRLLQ